MRTVKNWVNGRDLDSAGPRIAVMNPATDAAVSEVESATPDVVAAAIAAAENASAGWASFPQSRRAQVLLRFRELLLANRDEIAAIITEEHGKTLDDANGEVSRALESVELAASGPATVKGSTSLQSGPGIDTKSMLHPVGVCVGITPFNFPVMMGIMMAAVALSAGNSFILKPSEQNPTPAIRLAQLLTEAGLPDGVFNVLHGSKDVVEQLIDAPGVQAVSFVGSSDAAKAVYARASVAGKRAQAFGGAKNHLIVMPDADLDVTADQIASASFGAAGQRCMAISVAVVVGESAEPLLERVAERARAVQLNGGHVAGTEVGPVVSRQSQQRIQGIVRDAIAAGARAVVDRSTETVPGLDAGYFVGPTVLTDVSLDSPAYVQEIFGPILVVLRVDTLAEAVELIRAHRYGNGASIFTSNGAAANYFEREASAGMLGVNVAIPVPVAGYAVQGWKDSVFGDTGLNYASWPFYTRPKYVTSRWESVAGVDFGFRPN